MSKDLQMHNKNLKPIIKKNRIVGQCLDTDIRYGEDGKLKFISVGEYAAANSFFFMMCDKLSVGEIIDLSMEITRKVYGIYPQYDAIIATIKKYGWDTEIKRVE